MNKVWIVLDEKYGPQAVFSNEQAADYSCKHDAKLAVCGYSPWVEEFDVLDKPTVKPKVKRAAK